VVSKDTESENPFGEYEPSPLTGRWTLPHSGNHERALLGYLCCCLVEDVLQIAELLHPMDIHTPLHRALYKSIVRHARAGRVIIEAACEGIDRWLVTDVGNVVLLGIWARAWSSSVQTNMKSMPVYPGYESAPSAGRFLTLETR